MYHKHRCVWVQTAWKWPKTDANQAWLLVWPREPHWIQHLASKVLCVFKPGYWRAGCKLRSDQSCYELLWHHHVLLWPCAPRWHPAIQQNWVLHKTEWGRVKRGFMILCVLPVPIAGLAWSKMAPISTAKVKPGICQLLLLVSGNNITHFLILLTWPPRSNCPKQTTSDA